jgi:DNA-binding Lrp family transcriptional regulator
MDALDRGILTAIQAALPINARPYDALAVSLRLDPDDVLVRVRRLTAAGLIRRLGPIFDSRALGYVSTLVAARVPPERLAEVAERVNRLPGVTHNYERRHAYNLWFTLTAPSPAALEQALEALRRETGLAAIHSLPALAVYKIRVEFDVGEAEDLREGSATAGGPGRGPVQSDGARPDKPAAAHSGTQPLSDEQKHLVRLVQDGLAAEREPFAAVAARLGWPGERVVEQLREWQALGVIRRFGAVVRHRELGFAANGMVVFRVAEGRVDDAGRRLARHKEVSHCYRRPPLPGFPYNLFAMIHGRSEDAVRRAAAAMAEATRAEAHEVLFSVTEFKKASMRYFLE